MASAQRYQMPCLQRCEPPACMLSLHVYKLSAPPGIPQGGARPLIRPESACSQGSKETLHPSIFILAARNDPSPQRTRVARGVRR